MKFIKPISEKKFFLQVLSVAAAIVLWFAITYSEDPSIKVQINNIPLKTIGESTLVKNDLIFVNKNKLPNISIEVRGKRSDVTSILNSVSASVDISDITEEGEYTKELLFDVPNSSVMLVNKKISSITIDVEKSVSKNVPVYIIQSNTSENKNILVESIPETEQITISGTTDDISKIKEAVVNIDTSKIFEDNEKKYPFVPADANHNSLTPENPVRFNIPDISIKNECYFKKTVNIVLNPQRDTSEYQIFVKNFSVESIDVGVKNDDFDNINTLYADFENDIEISADGKYKMVLNIPENVYCPSPPKELIMTAEIEEISTEKMSLSVFAENLAEGLTATISPSVIDAEMTGAKSKMSEVKAKVDLSGFSAGTYNLPVKITSDNTGLSIEGEYFVSVTIQ